MRDLERTQRWIQATILHPDGVIPGMLSPDAQAQIALAPAELETVVTPSKALSAVERLAIYGRSYHARLTECLQAEFAVLRHALGDDLFDLFARAYLSNCPSQSFTLADLGERFPGFLESTRPEAGDDDMPWQEFILDLARLERAFNEVFDGPGVEDQEPPDAGQLRSLVAEHSDATKLTPVVCLRLLRFRYPVHDYFDAVRRDQEPELPAPRETFVAMHRRDYIVRMLELSQPQHELLRRLIDGETLHCALEGAGENRDALVRCLAEWADHGFFGGAGH